MYYYIYNSCNVIDFDPKTVNLEFKARFFLLEISQVIIFQKYKTIKKRLNKIIFCILLTILDF